MSNIYKCMKTKHIPLKTEYKDNTDRIEVERKFGLDLITTKRKDTTKTSILFSIIAMNIDRLAVILWDLFLLTRGYP